MTSKTRDFILVEFDWLKTPCLLFVAGVMEYWSNGVMQKKWSPGDIEMVKSSNSTPTLHCSSTPVHIAE
jgi:formylmethanofuran dehydrogenase subunit A